MGTVIFVLIEVILLALYGIAQWIKPSEVYLDNKGMAINTKRYARMTVKGNGIIEKELKNGDEVLVRKFNRKFTIDDVKEGDMVMMSDGEVRMVKDVGDCICRWEKNDMVGVVKYKI